VNAVIKRNTEQLLAMKTMDKAMIIDKSAVKLVMRERMFWSMFDHPLIIKFHWSFHDDANLYAVVDLMQGGDMRFHLKKEHRFNSARCKFYIAQIVESCQYIHQLGYLHRDVKPDNILFDHNGNICVTDFDLTKKVGKGLRGRAGTKRYMAPEVIRQQRYSFPADYWSIGIVLFEMLTGDTPYKYDQLRESEDLVKELRIPRNLDISDNAKEVIKGLLETDVTKRWGYEQIRKAAWFKPIDFESIAVKNLETPWKPSTKRPNVDGSHALDELISKHEKPRFLTSIEQELFRG